MLELNYMAWLGIVAWIGVPLLAFFTSRLLWRRSQSDLSRLLALVAGVVILFTPALISNGVKAYYDRQVRELCAKDGGIRVYETVRLPKEMFDKYGQIRILPKQLAKPVDEYFYEWESQRYRERAPVIRRDHFLIYRRMDGKLLGEGVSYARIGGDVPGPWIESSYRCPHDAEKIALATHIFSQQKGE